MFEGGNVLKGNHDLCKMVGTSFIWIMVHDDIV